jgi:hypothetical protein
MVGGVTRSNVIAAYRAFFGLLVLAAIGTQLVDLSSRGVLDPLHYFSYFTIDSNLLAAAVFLTLAARRGERSPGFEIVRGVAFVCMTVTGIVFTLLLSGTDVDTATPGSTTSSTRSCRSSSPWTGCWTRRGDASPIGRD